MKLWKLTDESTNLILFSNERNEIAGYEHATTIIEEGQFLTNEEIEEIKKQAIFEWFHKVSAQWNERELKTLTSSAKKK